MKSKLMSVVRLPDRFLSDLKIYDEIAPDLCDALTDFYVELETTTDPHNDQEIANRLTRIGTTGTQFNNVLATLSFARNYLAVYKDEPDDFVSDLIESGNISQDAAIKYLRSIETLRSFDLLTRDIESYYRGILPILRGAYARNVILTRFKSDDESDTNEDEPVLDGLEPFVVLNFEVDGPDITNEISMLLDEKALVQLIKNLKKSEKRIIALKKLVGTIV